MTQRQEGKEAVLKISTPQTSILPQQKANPDCEMCDGEGCMECSDTIFYAVQETVELSHRDRSRERAWSVAGNRPELGWDRQS